jgi:DNA-binding response OmpR family regulator
VCRKIRATSDLPIIFLTAASDLSERLRGFELGADDYVTKPAALAEVVQRVRAVLRRHERGASTGHVLEGPSELTLNARTHEVHVGAVPVELTAKEFAVLAALLERRSEVLSADTIALAAWGHGTFGERNFVEAQICRLRSKLASAGAEGVVRTIRRTGYVIR